ncbi:MAG: LamG domain-containing protein [Candidatus Pacebacteria bacterium]|nr:LamG domain-containing protein [Candidatus Paceibacterota bacterium]
MNNQNNKSFTLIEVLVVVIIIGAMAAIILVNTNDALENKQRLEVLNFSEGLKSKNVNSLVSEWTFDGPTPAGSAATNADVKDSWGYNDGDVTGHAPTVRESEDCVSGNCLNFDGNDYIDCGRDVSLDITGNMTVGVWIKPNSVTSYKMIATKSGGTISETQWEIRTYTDRVEFLASNGINNPYIAYKAGLSIGTWHYAVGILKNNVFSVYLNGVKGVDATLQGTQTTTDYSTKIGTRKDATELNYNFNGLIDDLRIYNAALSSSQIEQNYIAGLNLLLKNGAISKEEYSQRILNIAQND